MNHCGGWVFLFKCLCICVTCRGIEMWIQMLADALMGTQIPKNWSYRCLGVAWWECPEWSCRPTCSYLLGHQRKEIYFKRRWLWSSIILQINDIFQSLLWLYLFQEDDIHIWHVTSTWRIPDSSVYLHTIIIHLINTVGSFFSLLHN